MSGVHTMEQLAESVDYENASESERDYAEVFATFPKISWEGHCMYCGHCAPCPVKINVAMTNKFYDLATVHQQVPASIMEHYNNLESHASDCIKCGECEERCPFSVKIIDFMQKAEELFKI